jgi:hypothetical protein
MVQGKRRPLMFDKSNDKVRIDCYKKLDDHHFNASLMTFFRQIEAPFVYQEQVVPAMMDSETTLFAAVRDRAWPPWGLGAKRIGAVCQVNRVGDNRFGISPIYTADPDQSNIGLISAVYKEALDLILKDKGEVNYLVIEGSVLADRMLRAHGFRISDDFVYSSEVRYHYYRAEAAHLAKHLGLDKTSLPALLAHEIDDQTFHRVHELTSTVMTAAGSIRRDWRMAEILTVISGIHWESPPAQVPPPISRGPRPEGDIPLGDPAARG